MISTLVKTGFRLLGAVCSSLLYSYIELIYPQYGVRILQILLCLFLMSEAKGFLIPSGVFGFFLFLETKKLEFYGFALGTLLYFFFDKIDPRRRNQDRVPLGEWERRIRSFYMAHNPSKLGDVDRLLAKYEGYEESLWEELQRRYSEVSMPGVPGDDMSTVPNQEVFRDTAPDSPVSSTPTIPQSPPMSPSNSQRHRTNYGLDSPPRMHQNELESSRADAQQLQQSRIERRIAELRKKKQRGR